MLFAEWQVGQVLWSMLWFTLFFLWIWVVIMVFADIFRSHDMSGWAKALWTVFVLFLPMLGVLAYLIARGNKMGEHRLEDMERQDAAMRAYIRDTVSTSPTTPATPMTDMTDMPDMSTARLDTP